MPKYYEYKVCGYYLYYTSHCVIEAMHVHATEAVLSGENGSITQMSREELLELLGE